MLYACPPSCVYDTFASPLLIFPRNTRVRSQRCPVSLSCCSLTLTHTKPPRPPSIYPIYTHLLDLPIPRVAHPSHTTHMCTCVPCAPYSLCHTVTLCCTRIPCPLETTIVVCPSPTSWTHLTISVDRKVTRRACVRFSDATVGTSHAPVCSDSFYLCGRKGEDFPFLKKCVPLTTLDLKSIPWLSRKQMEHLRLGTQAGFS